MEQDKWIAYEEFKKKLKEENLTPEEYARRIEEYCKKNNI